MINDTPNSLSKVLGYVILALVFLSADHSTLTVGRIASESIVTTLAGLKGTSGVLDGTGTAARFNGPRGIATLPNGNLVVADTYNHAIRTITMPNGIVSTLAGLKGTSGVLDGTGTAARFLRPWAIATLWNGDVLVADSDNSAIRYDTAAGAVTTLAGRKGSNGFVDGTGTAAFLS